MKSTLTPLTTLLQDVVRDLHDLTVFNPRTVDELEAALAVIVTVLCAHLLGERNIGWAAFSAYMVMRAHASSTVRRGVLRVAGTIVGAALACAIPSQSASSPVCIAIALLAVSTFTLYLALTEQNGYAWLFAGITFCMVLTAALEDKTTNLTLFAMNRVVEVLTGTVCCIVISSLSTTFIRRTLSGAYWTPPLQEVAASARRWHFGAFLHALKGGIALALIPLISHLIQVPSPVQAGTTVLAVTMVPMSQLASAGGPTRSRMMHRFIGCLSGGSIATIALLLCHSSVLALALVLVGGVIVGRHIENSTTGANYIGTQFALAFLVVLVPDHYLTIDVGPGVERFLGVLCGISILYPVLVLGRPLHSLSNAQFFR
ncbi:FUSC family protein [Paraburkholderia flagellata]|uniref:FUSC family protein n=1 Tax=Paraburkholderia flagellata TaxID=2883241 RepID=UPI001F1C8E39|nr:FUSC family protein [Paraburkholderia flagellata]